MKLLDLIQLMPSTQFVVVVDCYTGEILIEDTVDRTLAFDEVDENLHTLLRNSKVCAVRTSYHGDLTLEVTQTVRP